MTTTTSESITTELEDRLAILELIGRLALTIDAKDWDEMGQPVHRHRLPRPHLAHRRRAIHRARRAVRRRMAPNAAGHGRSTPPDHQSRDQPRWRSRDLRGQHAGHTRARQRVGRPDVDGRRPPDYQLKRTPGGWRIAGLTFTLQWATGNMNVLTLAMAAGQS